MRNREFRSRVFNSSFATRYITLALVFAVGLLVTGASAWDEPEVSGTVSDIAIRMEPKGHSKLPAADEIGNVSVTLAKKDMNLFALSDAPQGSTPITIKVSELKGYRFSKSATAAVTQAVLQRITSMDIGGVAVRLNVPESGEEGQATVNIVVAKITKVNARRFEEADSRPAASAVSVLRNSPVQVRTEEPGILTIQELNNYIRHLNRFPRRNVTASISEDEKSGSLLLDYLIQEDNLYLYGEVSNFGTDATSRWLETFGLFATQLAGNDDILSIQAMTGNFSDSTQSIHGYYDSRLGTNDNLRWRLSGSWGEYTSADVGFLRQNFTGSTWSVQGNAIWNFYQDDTLFLDLDAGIRYWNSKTQSRFFGFLMSDGDSDFVTPSLSLSAYDIQPTTALQARIGIDYTDAAGGQAQLNQLGRLNTDDTWWTLYGTAYYSFYLDSLFDPETENQAIKPMVHEVTLRGQGQYAIGDRLTPQAMSTIGGYHTVRGYPQSVISGDSSVQGTVEYRFHLLRALESQPVGRGWLDDDFRWTRDSASGASPDWGLSFLAFFDAARVMQTDALSFENDATLLGAGIGLELAIHENFRATVNYGWALRDLQSAGVESGSGQLYFLGSISF